MFWVQILPLPLPPPPHKFSNFLNIVQYLFVHCTKPSILGSHPPYPQHCVHIPDPPQPNPPTQPPRHPLFFFLNFHKNFNSSFTSTLTPPPQPDPPPRQNPSPRPPISFELSQKLQFFVHIHNPIQIHCCTF